jgi:hypothetical protein
MLPMRTLSVAGILAAGLLASIPAIAQAVLVNPLCPGSLCRHPGPAWERPNFHGLEDAVADEVRDEMAGVILEDTTSTKHKASRN